MLNNVAVSLLQIKVNKIGVESLSSASRPLLVITSSGRGVVAVTSRSGRSTTTVAAAGTCYRRVRSATGTGGDTRGTAAGRGIGGLCNKRSYITGLSLNVDTGHKNKEDSRQLSD